MPTWLLRGCTEPAYTATGYGGLKALLARGLPRGTCVHVKHVNISTGYALLDSPSPGVILSGNNENCIFEVWGGATLHISNLTLAHGSGCRKKYGTRGPYTGGCISAEGSSTIILENTELRSCSSVLGGAVSLKASTLTMKGNTTIRDATANGPGGGVYGFTAGSAVYMHGTSSIVNGYSGAAGGGIYMDTGYVEVKSIAYGLPPRQIFICNILPHKLHR